MMSVRIRKALHWFNTWKMSKVKVEMKTALRCIMHSDIEVSLSFGIKRCFNHYDLMKKTLTHL